MGCFANLKFIAIVESTLTNKRYGKQALAIHLNKNQVNLIVY